jgi:kynureninase
VDAWQVSNAPVLQIAALRASLGLFDKAPLDALRAKSLRMGSELRALLQERLGDKVLLLTPEPADERGCQLSIRVGQAARRVCDQLLARGVVCDFRAPDVVRAAPTPLYNTFAELGRFTETLAAIYDEQPWESPT